MSQSKLSPVGACAKGGVRVGVRLAGGRGTYENSVVRGRTDVPEVHGQDHIVAAYQRVGAGWCRIQANRQGPTARGGSNA